VRDLSNNGLNPKTDLTAEHVTEADIAELFGGKGVKPFKTTNVMLHPTTKATPLSLCWKIYGIAIVPNNKFIAWIVKGFIAEHKGDVKINWAVATTSTAVEKKRRDVAEKAKLIISSSVLADGTQGTGNDVHVPSQSREEIESAELGFQGGMKCVPMSQSVSSQCPYKISSTEYESVKFVVDLAEELLRIDKDWIANFESSKKVLERKLVGLRFNLEDRITATKEDGEESAGLADVVQGLKLQIQDLQEQVTVHCTSYICALS
jgi:hypothetical protein